MRGAHRLGKWVSAAAAAAMCLAALPAASAAAFQPDGWFVASGPTTGSSPAPTAPAPAAPAATVPVDGWYSAGSTASAGGTSMWGAPPAPAPTAPASGTGAAAAGNPPNLPADSAEIIAWTNATRAQAGLPPLAENALLDQVALAKCDDMINHGYFGHDSPTYGTPLQMQQAFGVQARIMGAENIAGAQSTSLAYFLFVTSPGHLANIDYNGLTDIGVAVVPYGVYGVYVCQEFTGN